MQQNNDGNNTHIGEIVLPTAPAAPPPMPPPAAPAPVPAMPHTMPEIYAAMSEPTVAPDAWDGSRGFVHELAAQTLQDPLADYEFYFAGPPVMAEAVQKMLMREHKVPFGQLHFDRFF